MELHPQGEVLIHFSGTSAWVRRTQELGSIQIKA